MNCSIALLLISKMDFSACTVAGYHSLSFKTYETKPVIAACCIGVAKLKFTRAGSAFNSSNMDTELSCRSSTALCNAVSPCSS